ncbi:polysaccharide deacetylase family protein [Metabacillus fastidiosus]|uniref:polysaccharide deacetylase family protein n=1 Tax=Metabacillus fastidiosus TaxID=1458 RepID=UPI003D2E92E1
MKRTVIQITGFIIMLSLSIGFFQNPYTNSYVDDMKQTSVMVANYQDDLYQEIIDKKIEHEIAAQDAQIHKIWKAIPGYNGIEVDVDKSYEKMKKKGIFNENLLIYRQIKPKVHLSDLPPEPIYRGHPDKPMVSFAINVAWGNEYIPNMLTTLNKHHVKATFFLEGRWAKENPEMAKMIVDAGHEIGNHSYRHPDMSKITSASIREELAKTNDVIKATTEQKVTLFAPPSGSFRKEVVDIAAEMDMKTILWTVDTVDWQKPQPHVLIERVVSKIHNGAIVLMHPTDPTDKSLEKLILLIKEKGYSFGSVSMLLDEERLNINLRKESKE